MNYLTCEVRKTTIISVILLLLALALPSPGTLAAGSLIDDCGELIMTADGCLLFDPENRSGLYTLSNYGGFSAGDRVHVVGSHDINYFCDCRSRCIRFNSIYSGCSILCSYVQNDANNSGRFNIADITMLVNSIFSQGAMVTCEEQVDCNGNGYVDIGDAICMINLIY